MAIVNGTSGVHNLVGTTSADVIYGFVGNDTLDGGSGPDILTGGTGADRFVCNDYARALNVADTVTDFAVGTDDLVFAQRVRRS